ncbi:unnamed protein product [Paramecium primaurelia]|uniref:GYF domain-containing protein n=1 Tax=Paramecium primaurelia TaxID=5886 RepID=A0A8S1PQS9_PARPR|nr:unnamed protein product [Paramecium primaurelia]
MQQKLSRAQLIGHYRQKPIEQMPESFKALCQQYPQAFKALSQTPYQTRPIRGFNQEILVYSSNCATPLKTAGVYQSGGGDLFRFDEQQILTPQPKQSNTFDWSQQQLQSIKKEIVFSRSIPGQVNYLLQKIWYYVDDYLKVQGPFSSIQMDNWYLKGYFDDILRIGFKPENSESFIRIYQLKTQKQSKKVLKLLRRGSCPPSITASQEATIQLKPTVQQQQQQQKQDIQQQIDTQNIDNAPTIRVPTLRKKK